MNSFVFAEFYNELELYSLLFDRNCSKSYKYFICSIYTPICATAPTCKIYYSNRRYIKFLSILNIVLVFVFLPNIV